MVRKTKDQALETREKILEAATEIFVSKGVAGASLDNIAEKAGVTRGIAEKAGVTRGAIYWHFKNKMDIFEALHEQMHRPLMETVLQDLEKDHPEPLKQLEELCVSMLLDIQRNPQKKRILEIFLVKCDYAGDMECYQQWHNEKKAECFSLCAGYIEKAKAKGRLPGDLDAELITLAISCYMTGIAAEYLRWPDKFDMEKQAPLLIAQFFKGL